MKRANNSIAIWAVVVALLLGLGALLLLRPPSPGPSVVEAPKAGDSAAPTTPPGAAPTPPVEDKAADAAPSAEENTADTPAAEDKAADDASADTPESAEDKTADTSAASEEKSADSSPDAAEPEEDKAANASAQPGDTPSFDVVRIEPTGDGVLAGRAAPGWRISVESSGMQVALAEADDQGEWTVILSRPLPPGTHTLSLKATSPDGSKHASSTQTVSAEVATPPTKTAVVDTPQEPAAQLPAVTAAPTPVAPAVQEERDVTPGRVPPRDAPQLPQTAAIDEGRATPPASLAPQDRPGTYIILPGDTLWDIAQRYLGAGWRYKSIYRDNRKIIRNPNLIFPEQKMSIPEPQEPASAQAR
ncbi:MAG: LysM peptidoglycan-binding domain-containing protein [Methyloceanibacter sp.]